MWSTHLRASHCVHPEDTLSFVTQPATAAHLTARVHGGKPAGRDPTSSLRRYAQSQEDEDADTLLPVAIVSALSILLIPAFLGTSPAAVIAVAIIANVLSFGYAANEGVMADFVRKLKGEK